MQIHVLLFASYRELAGRSRVVLDLPDGSSPSAVFDRLVADYPRLEALRRYTTFAVNREVVPGEATLQPGDEVALLQPVSGGAA